jgi:hypothetical protein
MFHGPSWELTHYCSEVVSFISLHSVEGTILGRLEGYYESSLNTWFFLFTLIHACVLILCLSLDPLLSVSTTILIHKFCFLAVLTLMLYSGGAKYSRGEGRLLISNSGKDLL